MNTKDLKEEYVFTAGQLRAVWQTFGNTFTIAVSGLVIGLIMAADKYPSSGPIFVIFPLIIVAWYIMMDLQGKEIYARGKYLGLLERRIQKETRQPFPCVESRLQPHLYSTWRYALLWALVGTPVLLIYIFASVKALIYVRATAPEYFLVALVIYFVCPVISVLLMSLSGRAINRELLALKKDLSSSEQDVQPVGGDSVTPADGAASAAPQPWPDKRKLQT